MKNSLPVPPPGSHVFIDTMVFVYHLAKRNPSLALKAKAFLKDIEDGKYQGAVTTFIITEYLGVMKELLAISKGRPPNKPEEDIIRRNIMEFLDEAGIAIYDADELVNADNVTTFRVCDEIVANSLPSAGANGRWRGIGGADAINVSLAQSGNADYYASFDEGFRYLKSSVRPLLLGDAY